MINALIQANMMERQQLLQGLETMGKRRKAKLINELGSKFMEQDDYSPEGIQKFVQENNLGDESGMQVMMELIKVVKQFQSIEPKEPEYYPTAKGFLPSTKVEGVMPYVKPATPKAPKTPTELKLEKLSIESKELQIAAQKRKAEAPTTPIGRLMAARDKLPIDHPDRVEYAGNISKLATERGMIIESDGKGGTTIRTNVPQRKRMPAGEVSKTGEFGAYIKTMDELDQMIASGKLHSGPLEFIYHKADDWGVMPKKERIQMRALVARLPGLMYAMRGKQLSDKELEVALKMMPQMHMGDVAFKETLLQFRNYLNLILAGKREAYKGAKYDVGAFTSVIAPTVPLREKTIDERGDELSTQGMSDEEVMKQLKTEGYY